MREHEYFEQLSSLAAIGDLSPAEFAELKSHLHECRSCLAVYNEFNELADYQLPLADRSVGPARPFPTDEFRKGVLERAAQEGLRISPEAFQGPIGFRRRVAKTLEGLRWAILPRAAQLSLSAMALGTVVVIGLVVRHDFIRKHEMETLRADFVRMHDVTAGQQQKKSETEQAPQPAATNTQHLEQQLAGASARAARLELQHEQDLSSIASLESRLDKLTAANTILAQASSSRDSELADLRGQLEEVRASAAEKEDKLVASQVQIMELSRQLKGQESALAREQELLTAGRDIRDVMAARNLHIIDVHDMDARGESRPFGRIFLTEGKRLIFYAYDLDSMKAKNASFQAWGQRQDGTQGTVNLGVLYMDDRTQSRWALKVEDPNLLKAINSVFVTVEPNGGADRPTGKKLMYAFLGNPINHP